MNFKKTISENKYELWRFIYLFDTIFLDSYAIFERQSKRHKYRQTKSYSRLNVRYCSIAEKDVPLTDEIKQEAFNEFISKIKVIKWSEKDKLN